MSDWDVHLEFRSGSSNKFWRAKVEGADVTVNYGRIGSDGQSKTKSHGSADAALWFARACQLYDRAAARRRGRSPVLATAIAHRFPAHGAGSPRGPRCRRRPPEHRAA